MPCRPKPPLVVMANRLNFDIDENDADTFQNCNDIFKKCTSNYMTENNLEKFLYCENNSSMNIMHINCRSLNKNFKSITNLLSRTSCTFTAIGLSETWLNPVSSDTFIIDGYKFVCRSRTDKIGGGVGLFIDCAYVYQIRSDLSFIKNHIETIFIEIVQENAANIIIGCIYRPPNSDVVQFNLDILFILNILSKKRKTLTFIMGDFNLDLLNWDSHVPTNDFLNNLMSHAFLPTICHPTRITDSSSTLLDNIFSNNMQYKMETAILYSDISDHLPVLMHVDFKMQTNKLDTLRYIRLYSPELIENFKIALGGVDWVGICNEYISSDPNEAYNVFMKKFSLIFDEHFPQKIARQTRAKTPRSEWITSGLIKSCNKKSILYKKYIKNPSPETKNKYIRYRNKLKSILRKAEKDYYGNKFKQFQGNLTKTWKLLGNILNKNKPSSIITEFLKDGSLITDPQEIAEHFNDFFVNIGEKLANSIPTASTVFSSYLSDTESYKDSFAFFLTDATEIIAIVNRFNDKSSYGVDNIPINILKKCIMQVAEPLSALINSSILSGRVPDSLKIAKVCPIFKADADNTFSNYRPISVLPSFSKVFEKVVHRRLTDYMISKCILNKNQYGFRQNHSTYMAIQDMYNKITRAIDDREFSIGIFVDLSKAFDTINHDILLQKLEYYGIRGLALQWFKDYLTNRKQYVCYNNVSSSLMNVTCGVPQGSILGPLLFILYVNDIANCSSILYFILFADDTNIFYSSKSHSDLMKIINEELAKLSDWFRANKLSLNAKKTNYIIFGNKNKTCFDLNFHISINGNSLERVFNTKFLGVFVDDALSWKYHVSQISIKVSRNIGILNRVKFLLSQDVLLSLYYTMIHPHLLYCNIVWGGASQTTLNKLTCLQKRAIRLITRSEFRATTSPLFKQHGILKLNDIHKLQIYMFMFKCKYNLLPESCLQLVPLNSTRSCYAFRKEDEFITVKFRSETRRKAISVIGPELWNSLQVPIQNISSISVFKSRLVESLFELY